MVRYYIADNDGSNKVYLEEGQMPDPLPWLDYPETQGEFLTMMPGESETEPGSPAPGLEVIDDVGAGQGRITIQLTHLEETNFLALLAKRKSGKTVEVSPDNGTTRWEMSFFPGADGWKGGRIGGTTWFSLTVNLLEVATPT